MKTITGRSNQEISGKRLDLEAVYDKYAPRFLGLCYRYCGNRQDAEDIMHEGFLLILRNLDRFKSRGEGSLEAWMKKIMVNTTLKYIRDNAKYRHMLVFDTGVEPDYPDGEETTSYPDMPSEVLLQLITELPLGYRTVFNFYVMEDYSHREIAKLLGCTENTSKTQLMKARSWLKRRILEHEKNKSYEKRTAII